METQLLSRFCGNKTAAEVFLTQIRQWFNTLQSNGSFTQVLADRAQVVTYIQSSDNADLLSSNCTGYFIGLKSAIDADRVVLERRFQYYRFADDGIMQIIRNLLGFPRF